MSCLVDRLRRIPARLRENDPDPESYATKIRVLALISLAVFGWAPGLSAVYMFIDRPPTLPIGYFLLQSGMLVCPGTWWPVLAWGLVAGKTVPIMMDVVIAGSFVGSFLLAFGSPAFDLAYCLMLAFVATSLTIGTVWWKTWYAVGHLFAAFQGYNRLAQHAGWPLLALDPWKIEDINTFSYAISTFGFGTGVLFMCATLLLQRAEHLRATAAALAAEEVTATIAVKLQAYDTTAAAEALKHETAASVDKELKVAFTALVANLESYRPYLPNWLLATTDEDPDAASDKELSASRSTVSHSAAKLRGGTPPGHGHFVEFQSVSSFQGDASASSVTSDKDSQRHSAPSSARGSGQSGNRYRAKNQVAPEQKGVVGGTRATALDKRSYLKGSVTFAVIEYVTEDVPDAALSETLTAVADAVHQCAAECKGAVHTMLLGEIVVSWNVATRVAGPEAKAARFLLSLRTALIDDENVHHGFKAVAAAASHHARSETIGTSKKLLTSERIGSLRFKLRGILRFAWATHVSTQHSQQHDPAPTSSLLSVLLLDERTTREASSNFIISAGSVLDLAGHMPVNGMLHTPREKAAAVDLQIAASNPATVSPTRCISPPPPSAADERRSERRRTEGRRSDSLPSVSSETPPGSRRVSAFARSSDPAPGCVASSPTKTGVKGFPTLPGQQPSPPSTATPLDSRGPATATRHVERKSSLEQPKMSMNKKASNGVSHHGVVHVFDLVCPRAGGDDEWLYAMEEGAADAARAAQLMVGAGLRQLSGGVDAAAVRAAFEEAGKQRDGAAIMARPLVRQMVEGLDTLPVRV